MILYLMIIGMGLIYLLIIGIMNTDRNRRFYYGRTGLIFIITNMIFCLISYYNWLESVSITLYDGLQVCSTFFLASEMLIYAISILIYLGTFRQRLNLRAEFDLVLFGSLLGAINLVTSNDLLIALLSLQLMNLGIYFLLSFVPDSQVTMTSGLKYLLLSAFTTAIVLFSLTLLYGITGTLKVSDIIIFADLQSMTIDHVQQYRTVPLSISLSIAIILLMVGLLFKLGTAPFHSWVSDVYDGSPSHVTVWLATLPKLVILIFLLTLKPLVLLLPTEFLICVSGLSLIIGSVGLGAQVETRFKRILAYSAISHMGFLLLGFIVDVESFVFYYIIYGLTTVNIFTIYMLVGENIRGLFQKNTALSLSVAVSMFSLGGLPPMAGFLAKLDILRGLISLMYHPIFVGMAYMAIIASVISTAYYIRVIKIIYINNRILKDYEDNLSLNIESPTAFVIASITTFLAFSIFFIFL